MSKLTKKAVVKISTGEVFYLMVEEYARVSITGRATYVAHHESVLTKAGNPKKKLKGLGSYRIDGLKYAFFDSKREARAIFRRETIKELEEKLLIAKADLLTIYSEQL